MENVFKIYDVFDNNNKLNSQVIFNSIGFEIPTNYYFEKKSKDDTLLFINADLPFICAETIDDVLNHYFKSDKDALSVLVPVEIFEELGLDYSYEFDGNVPSGLNILRSENIIQEESNIVIPKVELALNINTLLDSKVAEKLYNEYYI